MEIRAFAERVLLSDSLEAKLERAPARLTDESPGEPLQVEEPGRPPNLQFAPRRTAPSMPHPTTFGDANRRAVAHHIMANHELQALEVMASVLCAFPDADAEFRRGLVEVMSDEQRHTRMHVERASAMGLQFGELPVNCYIWKKSLAFRNVLDYLATLPLTFEGRNLDHTLEFEDYFRKAGDERSAAMMRVIHEDEIDHVAFGINWLRRLKPAEQSEWEAYQAHLHWPLRPAKARGDTFNTGPRLAAGMTEEFVERLANSSEEA